jgi:predicted PurR-regulated permease PerM
LKLESIALPILTVMAGTAFLYFSAPFIVPLVAAIALAYILSPAVDLLKKARIPHTLAVLIVMAIGAVALLGTGYLVFQESMGLASELPQYYETVKGWLIEGLTAYASFQQTTGRLLPVLDESLLERISFADFSGVGAYIFKGLGSVFSSVMGLALIVLLTVFLLLDRESIRRRLTMVLGGDPAVSRKIIDDINLQIRGFMLVKFVTTVGLAIVFTVGLLMLDVSYAYVWGPLAAVMNLIPYVGIVIGMVPPAIMAAIQTGGITSPLLVIFFMEAVELLESNVITPKLVSDKVNLNLLAVLLSTVYWGWLWGMVGILLAVPITAAIKVVCAHIEPLKPIAVLLGGDADLTAAKAG